MRILHLLVIGILVFAAAYVYRIKLESTVRTERVLRLHADIREQRDAIAALRAEWTKLDAPSRLQGLVERHLPLKPVTAVQYDTLKNLPQRPPNIVKPGDPDPIGAMIDAVAAKASDKAGDKTGDPSVTGSVPAPAARPPEPEDQQ
jgi:cell division protein FtsL